MAKLLEPLKYITGSTFESKQIAILKILTILTFENMVIILPTLGNHTTNAW